MRARPKSAKTSGPWFGSTDVQFSANPVTKQLKCGDTLRSAGEYACSEDADIFAMWYVLRTLTDYLRLNFNENLRALTSAMGAMNKIRARYTQIVGRLPKIDAC